MSLLDSLLGNDKNGMTAQLAQRFGLDSAQIHGLLGQLVPALSGGMMNQAQQASTSAAVADSPLSSLFNLFQADRPGPTITAAPQAADMRDPATVDAGNSILGQIFGSKDVSREVANTAAQKTGVAADIVKQALPMVAIWAASALYKKFQQSNDNVPHNEGQPTGLLSQFLQGDQHHSIAQQVIGLLQKRAV